MSKVITTRIDNSLAKRLQQAAEKFQSDKATLFRRLILKGLKDMETEDALNSYQSGEISIGKLSELLQITKWDTFDLLREKGMRMNYTEEELEEDFLA